jgi:hypothetical protein
MTAGSANWDGALPRALRYEDGAARRPCLRVAGRGSGLLFVILMLITGCASTTKSSANRRHFDFAKDTFSYPNELVWEYRYDTNGKWTTRKRDAKPSYSQHCFVVARSAFQFFQNATFAPDLPRADDVTYRQLVRRLISTNPRTILPNDRKIVFPGYADLRSFSAAYSDMLKAECGGAWQSYFQRGHWRMIFPFSRHQQEQMANQLQKEIESKGVAVAHLVRFPSLSINHAVLMFEARPTEKNIEYITYDPNEPEQPVTITFDCESRTFSMPHNAYFPGGRVDIYPIYDRLTY